MSSNHFDNSDAPSLQTKDTQQQLARYEYAVISIMVVLALTSIIWSVIIHIISGDFYHGILGAKLAFRERDFQEMDEQSKEILHQGFEAAIKSAAEDYDTTPPPLNVHDYQTTKLFDPNHEVHGSTEGDVPGKVKFNLTHDREFLTTMMLDVQKTRWRQSAAVQFIYSFPFLSEIFAIIWTAMCLIFQSGVQKYWGLPKPWRIVVPSILVFSIMSLSSLIYAVLASTYLKNLCTGLRENLTKPDAISCGQAISVLRPFIRQHEFKHDVYLNIFRFCYMFALVLWLLALLLMVLRYFFAIDFQLMDVQSLHDNKLARRLSTPDHEFTEVLLRSAQSPTLLLPIAERNKSEDDFQSAKSHLSDVAVPLLESDKQWPAQSQRLI